MRRPEGSWNLTTKFLDLNWTQELQRARPHSNEVGVELVASYETTIYHRISAQL